jgi:hypothetical protein
LGFFFVCVFFVLRFHHIVLRRFVLVNNNEQENGQQANGVAQDADLAQTKLLQLSGIYDAGFGA